MCFLLWSMILSIYQISETVYDWRAGLALKDTMLNREFQQHQDRNSTQVLQLIQQK